MTDQNVFLQKRIFDWSLKLPDWQRALMRKLCDGPLDEAGRAEVLAMLCGDPGAPRLQPLELRNLPADEAELGVVELREIRDLRNVNRLAEDQALRFRPGLNVVFGENGAGKSGYGRLCRRVCRAAEPGEVLHDVFDPGKADAPQTAEFVLSVDGEERVLEVDLNREAPRVLSAMTAFDASCAEFCLTKQNTIEHTPRPLRLLKELADAQDQLAEDLAGRIADRREALPELPEVDGDPAAAALLARVEAGQAAREEVESFAGLDEAELEELRELEKAEAAIAADQSRALETAARKRAAAVERLAAELQDAWDRLDDEALAEIAELRSGLSRATAAVEQLAAEAFSDQPQPGTGGDAWREMWEAARRFVEAGGGEFPDAGSEATCPLCQQGLDTAAHERMHRFEAFVSGELREQVRRVDLALTERLEGLPDLKQLLHTAEVAVAAAGEHLQGPADAALSALADRLGIATGQAEPSLGAGLDLKPLRDYVAVQVAEAEGFAVLRDDAERSRIEGRLRELRARREIAAALDDVLAHLDGLEAIAAWEEARGQLATQKISNRIRELSRLAITARLKEALAREIAELDPISDRVELKPSASKGKPAVQFKLRSEGRERVANVLSTGEQTALATAFFLAELQVSNERSAIVLDDPISSLDHQRREHLATRLAEEAGKRQVVVLTHDLVFLYYLQEKAEELGVEFHGQALTRAFHAVGVVDPDLPWTAKSPMERLKALRHRLKTELRPLFKGDDPRYEREAELWRLDLRKAYERMIEVYVLGGTVERQARHIQVRKLHNVRWTPELALEIDAAVKELSAGAHQGPLGQQASPLSLAKLEALLAKFEALCEQVKPGRDREDEKADEAPPRLLRVSPENLKTRPAGPRPAGKRERPGLSKR
ncbi:MAG TPA: AAA family ATPase [Solirubrobacterales bacterium]|nr:AAA family ATPase [Solirubrobacterales bacterium]